MPRQVSEQSAPNFVVDREYACRHLHALEFNRGVGFHVQAIRAAHRHTRGAVVCVGVGELKAESEGACSFFLHRDSQGSGRLVPRGIWLKEGTHRRVGEKQSDAVGGCISTSEPGQNNA
eukprot:2410270-Rhodomonas_salina.1